MTREQLKEQVGIIAAIVTFIIAGMAFWKMLAAFLWICYYLGIKM